MSAPVLIAHSKPKPAPTPNVPYNPEPVVDLGPFQNEL